MHPLQKYLFMNSDIQINLRVHLSPSATHLPGLSAVAPHCHLKERGHSIRLKERGHSIHLKERGHSIRLIRLQDLPVLTPYSRLYLYPLPTGGARSRKRSQEEIKEVKNQRETRVCFSFPALPVSSFLASLPSFLSPAPPFSASSSLTTLSISISIQFECSLA